LRIEEEYDQRRAANSRRRAVVPVLAFVLGASVATGIATASNENGDDAATSTSVPIPLENTNAAGENLRVPDYSCDAYQEWGRKVYIPWWRDVLRQHGTIDRSTDLGEIPAPPADICE
jgi:hypothetical protein